MELKPKNSLHSQITLHSKRYQPSLYLQIFHGLIFLKKSAYAFFLGSATPNLQDTTTPRTAMNTPTVGTHRRLARRPHLKFPQHAGSHGSKCPPHQRPPSSGDMDGVPQRAGAQGHGRPRAAAKGNYFFLK